MTREQLGTMPLDTMPLPLGGHVVTATLSCPQPNTTVCTVTGRLDLVTASVLSDTLIEAIHDDRSHLVIDLSTVDSVDAAGLQAVFESLDGHDIDGHVAVVVDSNSEAITPLEIATLDEFLDRHGDLARALQACARASISTAGRHRAKVMS
ncbi:MAG: STAS domain-containing protein [Actinomycetota bacterium]|nr:STAS domain-containing protein [Actinomycetota bacterium]